MFHLKVPKTIEVNVKSIWDHNKGGISYMRNMKIYFDIPKEFNGPGRYACPGEIFLSSIAACLMNTFIFVSEKEIDHIKDVNVTVSGKIILKKEFYVFEEIVVDFNVSTAKYWEKRILSLIDQAVKYCYITRLVRNAVPLHINIYINGKGPLGAKY